MEQWRAINGYEGAYEVSNMGRVRSVTRTITTIKGNPYRTTGRVRKLTTRKLDGYTTVSLLRNTHRKTAKVHRLVAEAFIENPDDLPEVNHRDGNKSNNTPGNLQWATRLDNVRHQWHVLGQAAPWTGKRGADNPHSKLIVVGNVRYVSIVSAAEALGLHQSTVVKAVKRGGTVKGMEVVYG